MCRLTYSWRWSTGRGLSHAAVRSLRPLCKSFELDVSGRICADVGASTGGFTDCLLQHGAAKVYAIDVGQGILDWKLRQDDRVVVMEGTNARYVERFPSLWRSSPSMFLYFFKSPAAGGQELVFTEDE